MSSWLVLVDTDLFDARALVHLSEEESSVRVPRGGKKERRRTRSKGSCGERARLQQRRVSRSKKETQKGEAPAARGVKAEMLESSREEL